MFRISLLVLAATVLFLSAAVCAQEPAHQRSQELAAALDKTKYKEKEKRDLKIEIYVDVKNVPAVRADPADYSGRYQAEGYSMDLTAARNGAAEGSGYDCVAGERREMKFTLRDARIDGALLTAVKVYENGETRKFEAVFADRTVSSGKNINDIATRDTLFGLGFIEGVPAIAGSTDEYKGWTNRVFLEKK